MRFPHYHQLDARDCGPTCLKIIAKFYGKKYSVEELKDNCSVTRQGVSFQDLIDGAGKMGFDTLSLEIPVDKITDIPLPVILFWRQEHYVVLYKIKKDKSGLLFYISDPSFGKISLSSELFFKQWMGTSDKGVALLLEPNENFESKIPIEVPYWNPVLKVGHNFLSVLKKEYLKVIVASVLIIVSMGFTWYLPTLFRRTIDEGISQKNLTIVYGLLGTQLIIFLSQVFSDSISSVLLMQLNFKISLKFLVEYLHKLIRLPVKIFDNKINSDLMMRMDDNDRIQSFLTHYSLEFLLSSISLAVFAAMLYHYNVVAFLVFFALSSLSIIWTLSFLSKRKILDYSRFSISSETRNNIYELITEMPEIKINNAHKNKIHQWETLQSKLNRINLKSLYLNYYQLIGSNFFNRIKDIIITGVCAFFVIHNAMTLGVMLTIGYILGQLNRPIENIINIIKGMQDAKLSFNRLYDIQRLTDEDTGRTDKLSENRGSAIILDSVSFKYEGSFNPYVLKDISLTIPLGKITAIVGSSGSGKTTLLKLLLSIYSPTIGEIKIGSQNLNDLVAENWRSKCGVVLQDGFIYSNTYAQNIALADEDPDMNKVIAASKLACIDNFIESLPLKYNTVIGNSGTGLSGGQKQRILIARAVYKNPDFIFLDEATSSLDATNEKQILNNLQNFFVGRTVVIIAHRLSTVKNADKIVVLENGELVEVDNHVELVKAKGKYYELVKNQLELG